MICSTRVITEASISFQPSVRTHGTCLIVCCINIVSSQEAPVTACHNILTLGAEILVQTQSKECIFILHYFCTSNKYLMRNKEIHSLLLCVANSRFNIYTYMGNFSDFWRPRQTSKNNQFYWRSKFQGEELSLSDTHLSNSGAETHSNEQRIFQPFPRLLQACTFYYNSELATLATWQSLELEQTGWRAILPQSSMLIAGDLTLKPHLARNSCEIVRNSTVGF